MPQSAAQASHDLFEYNKPEIGGLYFYTHNGEEMPVIVCEIIEDDLELPEIIRATTGEVIEKTRKAYKLMILISFPKSEKVKYHQVTTSHTRWHDCMSRKA